MIKQLTCFFTFLFATSVFATEPPNPAKVIIPIYSQKVSFKLPKHWKPAFQDQNPASFMMEFLPQNETLDNWSEMFTVLGVKMAGGRVPLTEFLQNISDNHKKICGSNLVSQFIEHKNIDGHNALSAIIGCASLPNQTSEIAYYLAIEGQNDLYLFHKSMRRKAFHVSNPPITKFNATQYISNFLPIELCKNIGKAHECPK